MSYLKTFGPPDVAEARRVTEALLPIDSYESRDGCTQKAALSQNCHIRWPEIVNSCE